MVAVSKAYDFAIATVRSVTPAQLSRTIKVDWVGRPEVDGRNLMMNMLVHSAHYRGRWRSTSA